MNRTYAFIFFLLLTSCNDDDKHSPIITAKMGSMMCGKTMGQMQWLKELVVQSETDMALMGDIYAGSVDGQIIFIHQPMVMSCLACVLYDCDGNKIESHTMDHEKLRLIMRQENRIYDASTQ
jgi:hypothetical protein